MMNVFLNLKLLIIGLILFLTGCQSESDSLNDLKSESTPLNSTTETKPVVAKKPDNRPLSERKTGDLISKVMIDLADYDFETNQDIFVNLKGRLINTNKNLNWAIIQDKSVYYFAFGHAGMPMFSQEALGKDVYVRAIVEQKSLTDNELNTVKNFGLAENSVPDDYPLEFQLNTTKFDMAENVSAEEFIGEIN